MSDIGFEGAAQLLLEIIIVLTLLLAVPGAIWIAARFGAAVPAWLLKSAKVLTIMSAITLFVLLAKLFT